MTGAEYQKLTLKQMQERRWETAREMSNGNMKIPRGHPVRIRQKFNGLILEGDPCPHCGVAIIISRVSPGSVQEVTS